jgi:drug/metabolite transporter (DMT)-like permease
LTAVEPELFGILAALASAASWAIGAMLLKPYAEQFSALTLTFTKGVVALVVLGAAVLVSGSNAIPSGAFWILFASGALGIGIADTLFFRALRELSPHSVVQLMLLGQVATIGMAVAFLGESLISLEWIGVALVIVGVWVVLSDGGQMSGSGASPLAVLYGLASVLAMAASVTMAKGALESVDPLVATLIRIAGGMAAVVLIVFVFSRTTERRFHFFWTDWRTAAKFAAIAAFITFGGFFLSLLALKYARLAIANTLLSTEPLFVLLIAAVFLKERPEARRLIGSLISLAGIACISAKSIWS